MTAYDRGAAGLKARHGAPDMLGVRSSSSGRTPCGKQKAARESRRSAGMPGGGKVCSTCGSGQVGAGRVEAAERHRARGVAKGGGAPQLGMVSGSAAHCRPSLHSCKRPHLCSQRRALEAVLALALLARRVSSDVHAGGAAPLPAQPLVGLDVGSHRTDVGGGGQALAARGGRRQQEMGAARRGSECRWVLGSTQQS